MPLTAPSFGTTTPAGNFFGTGTDWTDPSQISSTAGGAVQSTLAQGNKLSGQGSDALGTLLTHFMKLINGDAGTVNQETQPQVSQVMSQYDTARQSIAATTPRGGGSASTINKGRFQEASDIANVKAGAITSAEGEVGKIGSALLGAGTNLQETGIYGLQQMLQAAIAQKDQSSATWASIGLGIGKLALGAGLAFTGVGAPASAGLFASGAGDFFGASGANA